MNEPSEVYQLLKETQTISESYGRVSEATGENFNVFSILQMESNEVVTHSRFLAELLNRKGTHGQKDKFLSLFIARFAAESKLVTGNSQVKIEYHIGKVEAERGGRIDILITDNENNVIMIENKIYAGEQLNQLLRYRNAFPQGKLFYLTLFGAESTQVSSQEIYETLSYEKDIIDWLDECRKESVNVPILRETISQYINLLKKLTHQNLNKKMNQDIVSRVLRDSNSLLAYKALYDLHKDLIEKVVSDIVQNLKEIFERKGYFDITTNDLKQGKGCLISFQTESLKQNNLRFRLNFESTNYSNLIIGFFNESSTQKKDLEFLEMVKTEFPNVKQSDWWSVYMFYEEYRDWHFDGLNKIYFDSDKTFYTDLENKVDSLMAIYENRIESMNNET